MNATRREEKSIYLQRREESSFKYKDTEKKG